jgi:abhydrolase domain-containing protein 12
VDWALNVAEIPADRIVLLGQSLGTAVTSAVAELYASRGIEFAGVVLVAGFSNLANLLVGYRISGYVPVLGPLSVWPGFLQLLQRFVVDEWQSAERLASLVKHTRKRLRLSLIAANDDADIPCEQSDTMFHIAANATVPGGLDQHSFEAWKEVRTIKKGKDAFATKWAAEPGIVIYQERFPYGGK